MLNEINDKNKEKKRKEDCLLILSNQILKSIENIDADPGRVLKNRALEDYESIQTIFSTGRVELMIKNKHLTTEEILCYGFLYLIEQN